MPFEVLAEGVGRNTVSQPQLKQGSRSGRELRDPFRIPFQLDQVVEVVEILALIGTQMIIERISHPSSFPGQFRRVAS